MSQPTYESNERIVSKLSYSYWKKCFIWFISETLLSIEFSFVSPYLPAETNAWIGVVPASIAHGSEWENDNHDVEFKFVSETLKGMFKIMNNYLDHFAR